MLIFGSLFFFFLSFFLFFFFPADWSSRHMAKAFLLSLSRGIVAWGWPTLLAPMVYAYYCFHSPQQETALAIMFFSFCADVFSGQDGLSLRFFTTPLFPYKAKWGHGPCFFKIEGETESKREVGFHYPVLGIGWSKWLLKVQGFSFPFCWSIFVLHFMLCTLHLYSLLVKMYGGHLNYIAHYRYIKPTPEVLPFLIERRPSTFDCLVLRNFSQLNWRFYRIVRFYQP